MRLAHDKVKLDNLHPKMWGPLWSLDYAWRQWMGYELVITSGEDGKHTAERSDHYAGRAVDMRTWNDEDSGVQISGEHRERLFEGVKDLLGDDWYLKNEVNHFHLSYRPLYREED